MTRVQAMQQELAEGNGLVFHDGELNQLLGVLEQAMKIGAEYVWNGAEKGQV